MAQALSGIRVVDFSHVLAGPIATHYLCMQGAEVTKIESAQGDTMRSYGGEEFPDRRSPSFISVNTGKRSVVLDLKDPEQLEAVCKLIANADVLVENFRPGVMERLGLGYETCKALNPRLVYCSISGFGQSGPLRDSPAIDQIIQSMSGLMELSGEPGTPAMRVGFPVIDTFTGLLAAFAIVSALLQRSQHGVGQHIDVAMLDASLNMMMSVAGPYLVAGVVPKKTGNLGYSKSPTADTFPTAEGEITLGAVRQEQYEALCRAVEREDLIGDSRFSNRQLRMRNRDALREELNRTLSTRTAIDWEKRFNAAGLAAGAVRTVPEALALEHLEQRALTQPAQLGNAAQVFKTGFLFAHDGAGVTLPAPRLGEHTREVLTEVGCKTDWIDRLCAIA